jgi:hypothetical protein
MIDLDDDCERAGGEDSVRFSGKKVQGACQPRTNKRMMEGD